MRYRNRWIVAVVIMIIAGLQLAACGQERRVEALEPPPAKVEKGEGTDFNRVLLTDRAAQRLGIQTAPVREEQVNGTQRKVIPYAAVLYGLKGETWAYTNPAPLTFVRAPITVDYIEGDMAVLVDGPPAGTAVVTVGVAQLYGTDTGVK